MTVERVKATDRSGEATPTALIPAPRGALGVRQGLAISARQAGASVESAQLAISIVVRQINDTGCAGIGARAGAEPGASTDCLTVADLAVAHEALAKLQRLASIPPNRVCRPRAGGDQRLHRSSLPVARPLLRSHSGARSERVSRASALNGYRPRVRLKSGPGALPVAEARGDGRAVLRVADRAHRFGDHRGMRRRTCCQPFGR